MSELWSQISCLVVVSKCLVWLVGCSLSEVDLSWLQSISKYRVHPLRNGWTKNAATADIYIAPHWLWFHIFFYRSSLFFFLFIITFLYKHRNYTTLHCRAVSCIAAYGNQRPRVRTLCSLLYHPHGLNKTLRFALCSLQHVLRVK